MIVTLKDHPKDPAVTLATVPYALNEQMARFEAAAWDHDRKAYLLQTTHVPHLTRFLEHHGHHVLDDRKAARTTPGLDGTPEPLPECGWCGAPARRARSATIDVCHECGETWRPIIFRGNRPQPQPRVIVGSVVAGDDGSDPQW